MSGKPLAHSARPKRGIPAQGFWEHIDGVTRRAVEAARRVAERWNGDRRIFIEEVTAAAQLHDCGKLAPENQAGARRVDVARNCRSVARTGGAAWLLEAGRQKAAMLVASHHAGLPSEPEETGKQFLSPKGKRYRIGSAMEHTAHHAETYRAYYRVAGIEVAADGGNAVAWPGVAHRMALSCLVDGDHTDTAEHYREATPAAAASLCGGERLAALDRYVRELQRERIDSRAAERQAVLRLLPGIGIG